MPRPVYVETTVRCPADRLWHLTQAPDLHPRWDLRFSSIRPTSVDAAGHRRERLLLARVAELRPAAVIAPVGRAPYPSLRRRKRAAVSYAPPSYPGPAGIGGSYPAPGGPAPLGQTATQYSEVDPSWKPPGE